MPATKSRPSAASKKAAAKTPRDGKAVVSVPKKDAKKKARAGSRTPKKAPVRPEDLLDFILVSDPQISPDGRHILFTRKHVGEKNNYVTNIWIADTKGGEARQFTSGGKDGGARWSPDGSRVAFLSGREKPKAQIYTISLSGGEAAALTKFPEGSIGEFKWSPDGKMLAVSFREAEPDFTTEAKKKREEKGLSTPARVIDDFFYRLDGDGYFGGQRHHLYVVDAKTGEHKKVFDKDTYGWFSFDWSPDSKELAISANTDKRAAVKPWLDRIYRFNLKTSKLDKIPNQEDGSRGAVKWAPDGKKIAYIGREGREPLWGCANNQLFVMDAKTGKTTNLTCDGDYCMTAAILSDTREASFGAEYHWTPGGKGIIFSVGWKGEGHIALVPAAGGPIKFLTKGPREFGMGNISKDGRRIALSVGGPNELNEIHLGTLGPGGIEPMRLSKFNDEKLSTLDLAKPKEHWIKSKSGTDLHVWVLKPPGLKAGKKAPAILEIHGGPHAQYGVPFFHEFQVLAAKGFVVVYSNPRGSKGYGQAHCEAIKGRWGDADWEDLQAVMEFMQKQPYIDGNRMGVMGGSYGGYMTNWVIGHTDVFKAAITDRCVSNLVSMAGNSDFPNIPDTYWPGNAWSKPETLWEQSPIRYFENVKTPTMIIHSEGDLRCNVEQSEQVFTVLKLRGVPTRFVRYPQETSHGMSRSGPPDLRIHRLNQVVNWMESYLKKVDR